MLIPSTLGRRISLITTSKTLVVASAKPSPPSEAMVTACPALRSASPTTSRMEGSSSIKRISSMSAAPFRLGGQANTHRGPQARCTVEQELTPVCAENAGGDGQPEPRPLAFRFGGEEGIADAVQDLGRNSRSAILDADGDAPIEHL